MKILVIGGGIFGVTIAFTLAKNHKVDLFEKNDDILKSASDVNQCRVHRGYHYPRSEETVNSVLMSEKSFREEFSNAIEDYVSHYYGISKTDSLTTADEYVKFCKKFNLEFIKSNLEVIDKENISILGLVKENTFDHNKIKEICWEKLNKNGVNVILKKKVTDEIFDDYDFVVLCAYSNINDFLQKYPTYQMDYQFEVCEKVFVKLPDSFYNKSIVIMDGPFMSIDPVIGTDMFIIGDVEYTVHQRNVGKFSQIHDKFLPFLDKGIIKNPPITKYNLFIDSASRFFPDINKAIHLGSSYCLKTVLPSVNTTDERPTVVKKINEKTITVFSGKIPSCVKTAREISRLVMNLK